MTIKKTIVFLLLIISLMVFSYYHVDRQLVWTLASHHARDWFLLKIVANDITNIIGAFVFIFYIYFAISKATFNTNLTDKKLVYMCNAVVISTFLKDGLKMLFGRYWPSTYICNNPSLIDNHVYGFNWFSHGTPFSSWPSGHATLIFAFSTSMWFLFPTLRKLWVLLALLVVIGQLGMYYHFFSDVVAGAALGSVVALFNYRCFASSQTLINSSNE